MPFDIVPFIAQTGRNFVADLPPNTVAVAVKNDFLPAETAGKIGVITIDYFIENGGWQAQRYVAPVWWFGGMVVIDPPVGGAFMYFQSERLQDLFLNALIYTDSFP